MLRLRFLSCALVAALVFSACSAGGTGSSAATPQDGTDSGVSLQGTARAPAVNAASGKVKDEDLDASWDETTATKIILNGDSIDVDGSGAVADGSTVTVNSAGTYVVSGSLADGQIIVQASESALVRLALNGVDIANSTTSPIYCEQADKLLLILADGSTNTITDSDSYVFPNADTDEPNAAIFGDADMTFNGTGALTVNASYNNGIGSKDDLIIVSGTFNVTAPNHAIRGRDSVTALDGSFTLNAGNDGIQSNNDTAEDKGWIELYGGSYEITAAHDGIQAETWLTVSDGDFHIVTGGGSANAPQRPTTSRGGGMAGGMTPPQMGDRAERPEPPQDDSRPERQMSPTDEASLIETAFTETSLADTAEVTTDSGVEAASDSFKGFKAGADLSITGGSFVIDSADDALHANGNITVSGGELTISTGDDGMHADADLVVSGSPKIDILTSYEGIEGATVTVSGGDINVTASDDGVNAAGGAGGSEAGAFGQDRFNSASGKYQISVEGGNLTIAAGADGLDANGDLLISDGVITFHMTNLNAAGGDGMLDNDGALIITGGIILGAGGNGIVMMGGGSGNSTSTQPILQLAYTNAQAAGTLVELKDAAGNIAASFTSERDFKCVIFSVPELVLEASYSVYTGGAKTLDLTISGLVTSLRDTGEAVTGMDGRGGGFGGGRGARPAAPQTP